MKPINPRLILPYLHNLQRAHMLQSYAAFFGGAALSLIGPMLVTMSFLLLSLSLIADHGFWGAYWIIAGCTIPLFFFLAWSTRGSILEANLDGDTSGGMFFGRMIVKWLIILEVANIGPRLVIWSIERFRGAHRVRRTKLGRVAQYVAMLAQANDSLKPAQLLFPEESADQLEPLLAFLLYHQIVDLAKRADRVWLSSIAREKLVKLSRKFDERKLEHRR